MHTRIFSDIFESPDAAPQRSLSRNKDSLSAWLNDVSLMRGYFNLSATEFRDVAIVFTICAPYCDGRGANFTTSRALDCGMVWTQRLSDGSTSDSASETLVADIGSMGTYMGALVWCSRPLPS